MGPARRRLGRTRGGPARGTAPGTRTRCPQACLTSGVPHRKHPEQAASQALPRGVFPCAPAGTSRVPGRPRAHPAPQRVVGSRERAARRAGAGGEPERSRGPAARGGRGREGCERGHLRAGSGEPHGEEHVQRRPMLDGARALLAAPPRGDFAVQLLSRSHAERAGVAVRSCCSAASHRRGGRPGRSVLGGGGRRAGAAHGARGPRAGGRRRRRRRRSELPQRRDSDASW